MFNTNRLHVGCGGTLLKGFLNIDRYAKDADLQTDALRALSYFGDESVELIYSNGFLEHMGRPPVLLEFLGECRRVLAKNGVVLHLGIPDFTEVAKCYLERKAGIVDWDGGHFGLENVYRYTHGLPEASESYMGQLHKDVFDAEKLRRLGSVFPAATVIKYCYPNEQHPLCLGLVLGKLPRFDREIIQLLSEDYVYGVNRDTVEFT